MKFHSQLVCLSVCIFASASTSSAESKKSAVAAKPTPAAATAITLQKRVLEAAASLKSVKTNDERIALLSALEKSVEADADKATVEGVRYSVALKPIFENRRELNEKSICARTRDEILHRFTSGNSNRGNVPLFVKDALEVLASACLDESLKAENQ
jgi:hypothetical protein